MHCDEELIADRNIRIVSQALIEMINALRSVSVCGSFEYSYIQKLAEKCLISMEKIYKKL